jgi:hypothetical protein
MEGEDEPKPLLGRSPHGMCMKMLVSAAQRVHVLQIADCCRLQTAASAAAPASAAAAAGLYAAAYTALSCRMLHDVL